MRLSASVAVTAPRAPKPMQPIERQLSQSKAYRTVACAFGVLFLALALTIVVVSDISLGTVIAAAVIGGLGLDAIVSALRNRKSLLARIGPLP